MPAPSQRAHALNVRDAKIVQKKNAPCSVNQNKNVIRQHDMIRMQTQPQEGTSFTSDKQHDVVEKRKNFSLKRGIV